jgi:hypothetical protein
MCYIYCFTKSLPFFRKKTTVTIEGMLKGMKSVDIDSSTGRTAPEAASDALNMCADKESREFKKKKCMTKQSLARP